MVGNKQNNQNPHTQNQGYRNNYTLKHKEWPKILRDSKDERHSIYYWYQIKESKKSASRYLFW